jgi:dTMP kinase
MAELKGKLIVIEGADGCGKQTQTEKLWQRLLAEGKKAHRVTFPDYASNSSALVKMYLNGDFGSDPAAVNPYAAASFYAADRFASFNMVWGKWYQAGEIIIADRYATSNMAHQAVKIPQEAEQAKFLEWLWDLEFVKFALPVPDLVVFLDVPPQYSLNLIKERNAQQRAPAAAKDIHEKNTVYLKNVYQTYLLAQKKYGWEKIDCVFADSMRSVEDIHTDIYEKVVCSQRCLKK